MIWVDYAILGIIALSTIIGLIRGFVKEAMQDADVLLIMTDITESPEILNETERMEMIYENCLSKTIHTK